METYLNKAIDEPAMKTSRRFIICNGDDGQSRAFYQCRTLCVMSDPQLDETVRRPVATYAAMKLIIRPA